MGALKNAPVDGVRAKAAASEAFKAAEKQYGEDNPVLNNGEGDAFRHALWSYKMAKSIGPDGAKAFGDAHERQNPQAEDGERLMDLYNNDIGRRLASDPKNNGRSDEDVIMEAIREGKLQLRPFNSPGGSRFQQKPRY